MNINMITLYRPTSIVFFVHELRDVAAWYSKLLGMLPYRDDPDFIGFHLDGIDLCFHRLDEKVGSLSGSQVAYWRVESLEESIKEFVKNGASIFRKPIQISEGGRVAQIKDPFGNILGLIEKDC